jgi:hypothetical protein
LEELVITPELSCVLNKNENVTDKKYDLPIQFQQKFFSGHPPLMADKNEDYNAFDIINSSIPSVQFILGGKCGRYIFIYAAYGGFGGPHQAIKFYRDTEDLNGPISGYSPIIQVNNLDEFREAVLRKKVYRHHTLDKW